MEDSGYSLFYKSRPSDGYFYGDCKYHYCFVAVYQSHLYGHLVIMSEPAHLVDHIIWSFWKKHPYKRRVIKL